MTATIPPSFIRLACPSCGDPAEVRRGPHGLTLACRDCRPLAVQFTNVAPVPTCRLCRTPTDGRLVHEDCVRKKGWA